MEGQQDNVYMKLCQVQNELHAPKNMYNSFGKYKYRNAESILEAAKPLCLAHGLCLTMYDEPVTVGEWHYIKATAAVYDIASDGSKCVLVSAYAREDQAINCMHESQVTGATSSFARKYALNALFCIDDTADTDAEAYAEQPAQKPARQNRQSPQPQPRQDALAPVRARFKEFSAARNEVPAEANKELCRIAQVGSLQELPADRVHFVVEYMERCIAKAQEPQPAELYPDEVSF